MFSFMECTVYLNSELNNLCNRFVIGCGWFRWKLLLVWNSMIHKHLSWRHHVKLRSKQTFSDSLKDFFSTRSVTMSVSDDWLHHKSNQRLHKLTKRSLSFNLFWTKTFGMQCWAKQIKDICEAFCLSSTFFLEFKFKVELCNKKCQDLKFTTSALV